MVGAEVSSTTLDLLFSVTGQSLVFDAPEGRPSSIVTSELLESGSSDDATEEAATSGSAAIAATPATTFDAASGVSQADPRVCNITDTTGVVIGRPYRLTNAAGEFETIEARAIAAGASVTAREPLKNDYAAADSFVTTRITHALDSTWIADTANLSPALAVNARYRWRLVYVVGGVTYARGIGVDLLRYPSQHGVSPHDVDRRSPGWIESLPTQYREDEGRTLIDEAWRSIKFDLMNLSLADQALANSEVRDELVTLRAIEAIYPTEMNAKRYSDRLAQLIAWGKTTVAIDETGAAASADARPFWRR